jgi:hypothetical protein
MFPPDEALVLVVLLLVLLLQLVQVLVLVLYPSLFPVLLVPDLPVTVYLVLPATVVLLNIVVVADTKRISGSKTWVGKYTLVGMKMRGTLLKPTISLL